MKIDHITAVVADSGGAAKALSTLLELEPIGSTDLPGMSITTFRIGETELHINSPTGPGPVAEQLRGHGPSLHHLAVGTNDLDAMLARLRDRGVTLLGPIVQVAPGLREVFVDPSHTGGILIQLVERSSSHVRPSDLDGEAVDALAEHTSTSR